MGKVRDTTKDNPLIMLLNAVAHSESGRDPSRAREGQYSLDRGPGL